MENKPNPKPNPNEQLYQQVNKLAVQSKIIGLVFLCVVGFILLQIVGWAPSFQHADKANLSPKEDASFLQHVADFKMSEYPDTEEGEAAAYGEKLIKQTALYLGPENKFGEVYAGNNLACASCHLDGGTKAYAAPYVGLTGIFPMFSGREGKVTTLEERINGCFERSMSGRKLPIGSTEMIAIVSYMKHLSKDVKVGARIEGQGFVKLELPDRKADLKHGELVYAEKCVSCHQTDGLGQRKDAQELAAGYIYPPLWGTDSFNDGAGMARMLTAAKFIKGNMPLGASSEEPLLTDEEAYDVAAYINSHVRPVKANKEVDYPNLKKKPKDSAYPPFADDLSAEQHKYGPFNFEVGSNQRTLSKL